MEDVKLRHCKLGKLCWLATTANYVIVNLANYVSRPDICARLARIAPRANSLQGSDVYCVDDLVKTVKLRQEAAAQSMPHLPIWAIRVRNKWMGRYVGAMERSMVGP